MEAIFVKPKFIELHIKDTTRSILVNVNQIASIESSNGYSYTTFIYLSSNNKKLQCMNLLIALWNCWRSREKGEQIAI